MIKVISKDRLVEVVEQSFNEVKSTTGGKNADYIPYLASVPEDLFGVSLVLRDGEVISYGDTQYTFGVESISKVFTAILILKQHGAKQVLDKIGADATGLPFNSILALLLESNHPSTPLVNAGAISAVSMVEPVGDAQEKWRLIQEIMTDMCGEELSVIQELYQSESQTNFNNHSIAWLLKNYGRIYDHPSLSLDLYTRQCSIGINTRQLSIAASTIAFEGMNPITGRKIFNTDLTTKIVCLMSSVGFYEHTGAWMYDSGIPAKTGVGGGVMAVMPQCFGLAAFAPSLDSSGNSVKAQAVIKAITSRLGVNIFSGDQIEFQE